MSAPREARLKATYEGATVVAIKEKRWDVRITLRLPDGTEEVLVASADSYYTDHNNIWFGTLREYEEHDQ